MIAFNVVVLPAPLRPRRQSTLARRDAQRHVPQHLDLAVEAIDAAQFQHHPPR
jgi:hypothetical protein